MGINIQVEREIDHPDSLPLLLIDWQNFSIYKFINLKKYHLKFECCI